MAPEILGGAPYPLRFLIDTRRPSNHLGKGFKGAGIGCQESLRLRLERSYGAIENTRP
jgi:hypothetical protein